MKPHGGLAALALAGFFSIPAYGQSNLYSNPSTGSVAIGTSTPTTGAALDLSYKTNSLLLPVGTTAQRPTGVAGMLRYNSTNTIPEIYTSSWLPLPLTASSPIVINSSTGNISCSTCNTTAANVISVSGDGTLYTNSTSTGSVTLTLGNATAYSVWGNNTSSLASPGYTTSPELSGTITDIQSIGATSTDGVVLTDTTAATSGNQKWSPRVRWTGQGWKTNATAASQEVDAIAEIQPVQGAANPSFNWVLSGQVNGGGYGALLTVPSGGNLNLNSGLYEINGTQLAASNLLNGVNGSGSIVLTISPTLTTPNIGAATGTSLAVTGNITTSGGDIGIGTASPINSLDVSGGAAIGASYAGADSAPTNGLIVQGSLGIGTTSPIFPLHVAADTTTGQIALTGATNTNQRLYFGYNTASDYGLIQSAKIGTAWEPLSLNPNGANVGIGTASPSYPMDVTGSIRTTQALLNSSAVPTISTCGTSPPVATTGSNNNSGQFTLGTGATATCTLTFANAFPNNAFCAVTPASSYTGTYYVSAQSKSAFTVTLGTGTPSVKFNYTCGGN
jgi:hypothetical protein